MPKLLCDFCLMRKATATDWWRYRDGKMMVQVTLHICDVCESGASFSKENLDAVAKRKHEEALKEQEADA